MKKGFTLMELTAVIVILGIIAIIATPMVLNVIEDTKEKAAKASANEYINGLNLAIATKELNTNFTSKSCTVNSGVVSCSNDTLEYNPKGSKPTLGYMSIENGEVKSYTMCMNGYKITQQGDNVTSVRDSSCFIEEAVYADAGLYRNGQLVYTWDELLDNYLWVEDSTIYGSAHLDGYLRIPEGITTVNNSAFHGVGLTGVILPESLTYIGYAAFSYNEIVNLTIPESVEWIMQHAFESNYITNLTISEGVEHIDWMAFYNNRIVNLHIPASINSIGSYAFNYNPIETITVDPNNPYFDSRDNCNAIIYTDEASLEQGSRSTVIPDNIDYISENAFAGVGLTSITIPNGVKYIDSGAFEHNQITSINIPASVQRVDSGAFAYNPLTSITVDSNNPYYDSRNNSNAIINTSEASLVQGSRSTVIPNTVTGIGYNAFAGVGLTSITIPNSVEVIGNRAFAHNQITSINIPASVIEIYDETFAYNPLTSITVDPNNPYFDSRDNCNAIIYTDEAGLVQGSRSTVIPNDVVEIYDNAFEGVGLTSITIPNGVKYIDGNAFFNNQLTSINIPASVEYIEGGAFAYNPLTSITVDPNNENYDSRDNSNAIILKDEDPLLVQGSRSTVIPETVNRINSGAFAGIGLTSITIPEGVWSIGPWAFDDNTLTSVTFEFTDYWWYSGYGDDYYYQPMPSEFMSNPQKMASIINAHSGFGCFLD